MVSTMDDYITVDDNRTGSWVIMEVADIFNTNLTATNDSSDQKAQTLHGYKHGC